MALDDIQFVEKNYGRILRAAILLTGDRVEAEDLAQETFLRALDNWNKFQGKSSRKTWVYSILLNVHKSNLRGARRYWNRIVDWFQGGNSTVCLPDDGILQEEWKCSLWLAVSRLPTPQQETVVLRFADELSYAEIAEVMSCPIGTVKSRLNVALTKLSEDSSVQLLDGSIPQARAFLHVEARS